MKSENYVSRDLFYKQSQAFFAEGLLKELYSSDKISICNASNAFYLVFNYTITKSGPIGVVIEPKYIEPLMKNDNLFNELYNVMGAENFEKNCGFLNKKTFEYLKQEKRQTDLTGPYVDLEYEKSLTENLKSR